MLVNHQFLSLSIIALVPRVWDITLILAILSSWIQYQVSFSYGFNSSLLISVLFSSSTFNSIFVVLILVWFYLLQKISRSKLQFLILPLVYGGCWIFMIDTLRRFNILCWLLSVYGYHFHLLSLLHRIYYFVSGCGNFFGSCLVYNFNYV